MELREHIRIARKSWVPMILLALVGAGGAASYSLMQTAQYGATSRVFVSTQSSGANAEQAQGDGVTVQRVKTYADLVSTPIVLLPAIGTLELDISSDQLAARVASSVSLDTSIIDITVTDLDPARAAKTANAISQSLIAVVNEIETPLTADAISPVKLTQAQEATAPSVPVSPNMLLNITVAGLGGLALGLVLARVRANLESRIRNEHDVENITGIAILGGIVFDPKAQDRPLIVHVDPRGHRAESFRTLRTNVQFLNVERAHRSFVVSSAIGSEGKSTTSANLAIALAEAGSKVLLIDADLRRPKIADYMGIEGAVGLTEVLTGRAELDDVIQPWGRAKLYVLPAGHTPPNPSELLGSARMSHFVEEFADMFDVVIYDTSPLLPVTDAAILARTVGNAIIVVAAGRTRRNHLKEAIAVLANVGAPVSGLVLTMLPTKGPDVSRYSRSGFGYEYGQVNEVAHDELTRREVSAQSKRSRARR